MSLLRGHQRHMLRQTVIGLWSFLWGRQGPTILSHHPTIPQTSVYWLE